MHSYLPNKCFILIYFIFIYIYFNLLLIYFKLQPNFCSGPGEFKNIMTFMSPKS